MRSVIFLIWGLDTYLQVCQFLVPVRNPSEAVVFDAAYSVTLRLARGRLTVSASAPRRTRTARHGTLPLRERP